MLRSGSHAPLCVIAAPRAGTTALAFTLGASGQFHNFGEIFHVGIPQRKQWPHLFVNFAAAQNLTLENLYRQVQVEIVAERYLEYLSAIAGETVPLLDVKFNSWQMLRPAWSWPDDEPTFMRLLKKRGCAFVFIRRRDLTEQILSRYVARRSGLWHTWADRSDEYNQPESFDVSLPETIALAEAIVRAEAFFDRLLRDYPLVCSIAYEDLFSTDKLSDPVNAFLSRTFGVVTSSLPESQIRKNTSDKRSLVRNYDALKVEVERIANQLNRSAF